MRHCWETFAYWLVLTTLPHVHIIIWLQHGQITLCYDSTRQAFLCGFQKGKVPWDSEIKQIYEWSVWRDRDTLDFRTSGCDWYDIETLWKTHLAHVQLNIPPGSNEQLPVASSNLSSFSVGVLIQDDTSTSAANHLLHPFPYFTYWTNDFKELRKPILNMFLQTRLTSHNS